MTSGRNANVAKPILILFRKSQQGSPYYGHAQPENEGMAEVADGN